MSKITEIKNLWDKLGTTIIPGSSTIPGKAYHEVPFSELKFSTHRSNLNNRVNMIKENYPDYKGKYGLDLGCSVGGLTFSMQLAGAKQVLGVDYDSYAINVANKIEEHYQTGAKFVQASIDLTTIDNIIEQAKNPETDRIDFILWYSNFMWILKQQGLEKSQVILRKFTDVTDVMFFESSQGDKMTGAAMRVVGLTSKEALHTLLKEHTAYTKIVNLGNAGDGWSTRDIFYCTDPNT